MKFVIHAILLIITFAFMLPLMVHAQSETMDLKSIVSTLEDEFLKDLQTEKDYAQVFDNYEKELKSLIVQNPGRMEPYGGFSELMEKCDSERSQRIINEILNTEGLTENLYERYSQIDKALQMVGVEVDARFISLDGKQINLGDYKGKVVLLDFWATWCGPCIREIPKLKAYFSEFEEDGLEVVGISFDDDKSKLKKFILKEEIPWRQIYALGDQRDEVSNIFNVTRGYLPTVYLIGRDGRIRYTFNTRFQLKEKIRLLLDEKK